MLTWLAPTEPGLGGHLENSNWDHVGATNGRHSRTMGGSVKPNHQPMSLFLPCERNKPWPASSVNNRLFHAVKRQGGRRSETARMGPQRLRLRVTGSCEGTGPALVPGGLLPESTQHLGWQQWLFFGVQVLEGDGEVFFGLLSFCKNGATPGTFPCTLFFLRTVFLGQRPTVPSH